MIDTRHPSLFNEFTRGTKIFLRLSALLVMAGCQRPGPEPEASIVEALLQSHPAAHLIAFFER